MLLFINYVQKTSWKRFQKHWREYQSLKKYCDGLKESVCKAQLELVSNVSELVPVKSKEQLKCVRSVVKDCLFFHDPDGVSVAWSTEYCPNFHYGAMVSKCKNEECPYIKQNHNYCELEEKYNYWLDKKNNFWHEKFLAAKSK